MGATPLEQIVSREQPKSEAPPAEPVVPEVNPPPETGEGVSATPAIDDDVDHDSIARHADDPHKVPRKSYIEERKKRQELEREIAELRGYNSALSQNDRSRVPQPQPQQTPDPLAEFDFADPAGYIEKKLQQRLSAVELKHAAAVLNLSVAQVKQAHPDYNEKEAAFLELVQNNPAVLNEFRLHPHPAEFAYNYGQMYLEAKQFGPGGIAEYRERIKKEAIAEYEAELKKRQSVQTVKNLTQSTANARGSGGTAKPAFSPTPLSAIARGTGV